MGTATKVGESGRIRIGRYDRRTRDFTEVLFVVGTCLYRIDDLDLEGLVLEDLEAIFERVLRARERLIFGDDLSHFVLDATQIVVTEPVATGQGEVVVETVANRWSYCVMGAGP